MNKGQGKYSLLLVLFPLLLFSFFVFPNSCKEEKANYVDVAGVNDHFVAVTNKGRIDWIAEEGLVTESFSVDGEGLTSIVVQDGKIYVAGDQGTVFFIEDENIRSIKSGTKKAINCIAVFKDMIITGYDEGMLRTGSLTSAFKEHSFVIKGDVVDLFADNAVCYGVTNKGEILKTQDGYNWSVFDFNIEYKGFYKPCEFSKIYVTSNQIAVIGKNYEDMPVLYFSSKGNVWTERMLTFSDANGHSAIQKEIPNDIYHDPIHDQYILVSNGGKVLTIPACSHCHKQYDISEKNILAVAGNANFVIMVGEDGYIEVLGNGYL